MQQWPEPTQEYIEAMAREMKLFYNDEDKELQRTRSVRLMQNAIILPKRYTNVQFRDTTIAAEVQRKVAALALNWPKPKVVVDPDDKSDKAQEHSTKLEYWTLEALRKCGQRIQGEDTYYSSVDACYGDGGAWTKLVYAPQLWDSIRSLSPDDFEDDDDYEPDKAEGGSSKEAKYSAEVDELKKKLGPPFYWLPIDDAVIYPRWNGLEVTEVIECTERPLSQAMREFGFTKGDLKTEELAPHGSGGLGSANITVRCYEYWNDQYYSYLIVSPNNSKYFEKPEEHHYGFVPYYFAPGIMMNWWRGRKIGQSGSATKMWLSEYSSFLMTLHADIAAIETYPVLFRKRGPAATLLRGKDNMPISSSDYHLGTIIEGGIDEDLVQPMQWPPIAAAFKDQMGIVTKALEKLESPRVGSEIGRGLEGAGFAMSQVLAEARIQDAPFISHIEQMMVNVTLGLWKLCVNLVKTPIFISPDAEGKGGWLVIDPEKDLKDAIGIRWFMDPERATAKLVESRYWHERVKAGSASMGQAIEALGDNPDEVRFQRALDAVRMSPQFQQIQLDEVMTKAGRGDILTEAINLAKTGGQPIPTTPPGALAQPKGTQTGPLPLPGGAPATPANTPGTGVTPASAIPGQSNPANLTMAPGGAGVPGRGPAPVLAAPRVRVPTAPNPAARRLVGGGGVPGAPPRNGPVGAIVPLQRAINTQANV